MADAAIEFLLHTIKDLLKNHSQIIKDTKVNMENIQSDLLIFKAFLRDIVSTGKRNEVTKALVKEIHDVVYEVEDIIEVFVTKTVDKSQKNVFTKFWSTSVDLPTIGRKLETVKVKVEGCWQQMSKFVSLHEVQPENFETWPPRKKDVVGFEDVTEDLISRMLQETDYFDVISIIGMLGLGKTTVAWKIFNDPRIVSKFPVRIWLPISHEFNAKEIFLDILKELVIIDEGMRAKKDYELADLVAANLKEGSFLMVMDDLWEPADWVKLNAALPDGNMKGKVLITSRHERVGACASSPRPLYNLRFFTFEESWKLFRREALHKVVCPAELEDVGKEIAEKCKGLPLAIAVIGGILATKTATRRDWEEVSPRVCSYLNENDPTKRMQKLITLSYDNLPYHLRACFLYMGMFPEGYAIPVSKLTHMWIGEGFVQQNDHWSLERTAQTYLEDLINRNLVKIDKYKANGKVKTCRIHDTLRDICLSEAANEYFLQGIKCNSDGQFVPSLSNMERYRRLFIHSDCSKLFLSKPFGPRVRSFISFPKDIYVLSVEEGANLVRAFQLLRMLDVLAFNFTRINNDLYKLVHMRYIALSSSNLSVLPSRFDKLGNIQTLIVDTTSRTLEVKADIWKMKRLRHFKTNASALLKLTTSKENAELQTLGLISVESCTEELTRRACNLKKLGIRGKLALLFDGKSGSFDSLRRMIKLEKLKLINDVFPTPPSTGRLSCLPEHDRFPSGLTNLTLSATFLGWENMSTLGLLKKLEVLKLKDHAFMGNIWDSVGGGFLSLEILHIEETNLESWKASSHHFPQLRGLVLKKCRDLLGIPIELATITSLQMLELYYTCKSAAESAEKISVEKKRAEAAGGSKFMLSIYPLGDEDDQI